MVKKNKKTRAHNYLDYIPSRNEKYKSAMDDNGNISIHIENKGVFNKAAQFLLKKPKVSKIHLDEMGSYVWTLIDGRRSVYDISVLVRDKFGEAAEPLYERLVQYMQIMEQYAFINMLKAD